MIAGPRIRAGKDAGRALVPRPVLSLQGAVWIIGVLVIAGMSAFQYYDVVRRLEIVLEASKRELASTVRLLAEQAAGSLQAVELVLREAGESAALAAERKGSLPPALRDRVQQLHQIASVAVVLDDGSLFTSAGGALGGAQSPGVLEQLGSPALEQPDRLHVSDPLFLPRSGTWTAALSRPLHGGKAGDRGMAVAYLDLEYFRRFYASLELPPGTRIALLGRDARPLVEQPAAAGTPLGAPSPTQTLYRGLLAASPGSSRLLPDPAGGEERIYVAQAVPGFPLAVGVSTAKSAVLSAWYVQSLHSAARTSLLCLSVALLMWLVLRQLRRRELAESQLRVQSAYLDELIESAPEAIALLDARGQIVRVNREFTRLFDHLPEQAVGNTLEALIVPAELLPEAERMTRAVRRGEHVSSETHRMRRDGSRLAVSVLCAPIAGTGGPIASFAIYRDITERRQAESERAKLESRLLQAEKLEAIGTMAGGIAHDFNGIVSAILASANLAIASGPDERGRNRYLANIVSAADRGRGLVEQILTYSRSTRGKRVVVQLQAVVKDTLELVEAGLPGNVQLEARLAAPEALVIADPTHVHQLVMNLCSNAVHSMEQGGSLTVSLDAFDSACESALSHGTLNAGRYARLVVRDTGRGMREEILDRIFEPFFSTGHDAGGTGLGLALVYAIVTELAGGVDVQTAPGRGSSFTLFLPTVEQAAMDVGAGEEVPLPRGHGERVLLVDDEQATVLLHEEMLAALNYEPAGFSRPADALAEFVAGPGRFDVVLLDQLMPEMTGLELARRIRAVRQDIPILVATGYPNRLIEQEAIVAGVQEILSKPLDFRRLAQALHGALATAPRTP